MVNILQDQTSFASGELSNRVAGAVGTPPREEGVEILRNATITETGSIRKRSGTKHFIDFESGEFRGFATLGDYLVYISGSVMFVARLTSNDGRDTHTIEMRFNLDPLIGTFATDSFTDDGSVFLSAQRVGDGLFILHRGGILQLLRAAIPTDEGGGFRWTLVEYSSYIRSALRDSFLETGLLVGDIAKGASVLNLVGIGTLQPFHEGSRINISGLPQGTVTTVTPATSTSVAAAVITFTEPASTSTLTGSLRGRVLLGAVGNVWVRASPRTAGEFVHRGPAWPRDIIGKIISFRHTGQGLHRVLRHNGSSDIFTKYIPGSGTNSFKPITIGTAGQYVGGEFYQVAILEELWTAGNYPKVLGFHQNRFILANTATDPSKIWFSGNGDYFDFRSGAESDESGQRGFSLTLNPGAVIRWVLSKDALFVGTSEGVYLITHDKAFVFNNITQKRITSLGTIHHRPPNIGPEIFFIDSTENHVQSLYFDRQFQGYLTRNVTASISQLDPKIGTNLKIVDLRQFGEDLIAITRFRYANGQMVPGPLLYGSTRLSKRVVGWSEWTSIYQIGDVTHLSGDAGLDLLTDSDTAVWGAYVAAIYVESLSTLYFIKQYGDSLNLEEYSALSYMDLETTVRVDAQGVLTDPVGIILSANLSTYPGKVYLTQGGVGYNIKDQVVNSEIIPAAISSRLITATHPILGLEIGFLCRFFEPQVGIGLSYLQGSPKAIGTLRVTVNQSIGSLYQNGYIEDGFSTLSSWTVFRNVVSESTGKGTYEALTALTGYYVFNNPLPVNFVGQMALTSYIDADIITYGPLEITAVYYNVVVSEE